jgi:hypothetical protein
MLKIYVAASFEQRDTVKEIYKLLTDKGHIITADWTNHKEIVSMPTKIEQERLAKRYAIEDTNGVKNADVFILLLEERKSTGAHIELGIAIGAHVSHIFIVGEKTLSESQLFYRQPQIKYLQNIREVIKIIDNLN